MNEKDTKEIKKLSATFKCSKNYVCQKTNFKNLCKTKGIGAEGYALLKEKVGNCKYLMPFGSEYYCRCPIRIYVAKNLKK